MELKGIQFLTLCLAACISVGFARAPKQIIKGDYARLGEFPHQVSLQTRYGTHYCGGSIITASHILTAAHCVIDANYTLDQPEDIFVITGVNDRENRKRRNVFGVIRIIAHEKYDPYILYNDIAILELNREIEFNLFQSPISLPTEDTPSGTMVEASGWGVADHPGTNVIVQKYLRELPMTVVSSDQCRPFHPQANLDRSICVKSKKGSGVCNGDSGSPLTYGNTVIGIASFVAVINSVKCATGPPDVYTSVKAYVPWIEDVIGYTLTS